MAVLIPDKRYVDHLWNNFILNCEERSRPVATSTANGPLFERDSTNLRPLFCKTFQLSATMFSFPSPKENAHLPKNQFLFLLDSSNSKWSKFFSPESVWWQSWLQLCQPFKSSHSRSCTSLSVEPIQWSIFCVKTRISKNFEWCDSHLIKIEHNVIFIQWHS